MKNNIEEYPLIKQEINNHTNIKTYCVSALQDNYIFPVENNNESNEIVKNYSLETWKKLIERLNWNY